LSDAEQPAGRLAGEPGKGYLQFAQNATCPGSVLWKLFTSKVAKTTSTSLHVLIANTQTSESINCNLCKNRQIPLTVVLSVSEKATSTPSLIRRQKHVREMF
jgi:hypothetical protein